MFERSVDNTEYVPISFVAPGKQLHLPVPQLSSLDNGHDSASLEHWQGKSKHNTGIKHL